MTSTDFSFNPPAGTYAGADYEHFWHLCVTLIPVCFGLCVSRGDTPLVALMIWRLDALGAREKTEECACCTVKHWRCTLLVFGADPSATTLAACPGNKGARLLMQTCAFEIILRETDEHETEEARAKFDDDDEEQRPTDV